MAGSGALVPVLTKNRDQCPELNRDQCPTGPWQLEPGPVPGTGPGFSLNRDQWLERPWTKDGFSTSGAARRVIGLARQAGQHPSETLKTRGQQPPGRYFLLRPAAGMELPAAMEV